MIGHDHVADQIIPRSIVQMQLLRYCHAQRRFPQKAGAMTGIQIAMYTVAQQRIRNLKRYTRTLFTQMRPQTVENCGRQGVGQAEGDRLSEASEVGVWEMATGAPATTDVHGWRLCTPTAD